MLISVDILPEIVLYATLLGLVFWLLYRRYIFSVADPLFIFVVTTTFASVLVIEVVEDPRNIIHYFICHFFAWAGFAWVQQRTGNPAIKSPRVDTLFTDVALLRYTSYVLFGIYVCSNLIILQTKGFALLSDAPSEAKVANFQEGFGIFRKINWAVGGVASAGLLFLFLLKKKRQDLVMLIIVIAFNALDGSKGALLRYVIMAALFIYHPAFRQQRQVRGQIKKYAPMAAAAIFGVFFTVLARENDSLEAVFLAFVRRLLYGADGILFFYHPANVAYFAHYSWIDFPAYVVNPVLGFLRLAPYEEAFGNIMVENTLPPSVTLDIIVGPNSGFYTEGQVFFGYYGAFIYSLVLGGLASWIRSIFFSIQRSSAFGLVFISVIYQFSLAILVDLKLFITQSFDAVLLVLPVYVLVCFVVNRKIVFHRLRFSGPYNRS
jgi:oligosaccharide repeat unit polymerase